jgi:hypothetical protein
MLMNLEGFQHATSLDLNMGYYHPELSTKSRELCTIVLPFGKYDTNVSLWAYATVLTSSKKR